MLRLVISTIRSRSRWRSNPTTSIPTAKARRCGPKICGTCSFFRSRRPDRFGFELLVQILEAAPIRFLRARIEHRTRVARRSVEPDEIGNVDFFARALQKPLEVGEPLGIFQSHRCTRARGELPRVALAKEHDRHRRPRALR